VQEEQLELDTALAVSDARADIIENELRQTDQAIIEPTQPSVQLNPPSVQLNPEVESYVPSVRIDKCETESAVVNQPVQPTLLRQTKIIYH